MTKDTLASFADPFMALLHRFLSHIPSFAAAFLLLLAGMFTARALRTIAERMLDRTHLDEYTSKVGINEVLIRLGLGKSPSFVISFLIYWLILFVFFVSAANAVNLTAVSELLERFVLFLPSLIACLLIIFGGLLFASFLTEVVERAATANNIRGGKLLSRAAYVIVIVFSLMTAMEQLGMQLEFISNALQILLASAGLAAAIAFGLGGKETAADLIKDFLKERT